MKQRDLSDLLLLAAIWGGSFMLMRVLVPHFGALPLAFVRVLGASLFLLPLLLARGEAPLLRQHWRSLLLLGLTNSALPFLCFGYAVATLPAALAAIFNAATPLFTALIALVWLGTPLTRWQGLGMGLGFVGVVGLALYKSMASAGLQHLQLDLPTALAIGACLLATLMYGFSANHAKRCLPGLPAMAMAAGTQLAASAALAVPAALLWPATWPPLLAWGQAALLAVLASGVAYVLYFRLVSRVGPTQAASVTFLVPVFAALWGVLLLDEAVTAPMLLGGGVILAGTALVLKLWPAAPRPNAARQDAPRSNPP